jgi:hypothetical protein
LEVATNDIFSEEESFTFQSAIFDKESKKMILERGDQKSKKGKSLSKVDLKDMRSSKYLKFTKKPMMLLLIPLMGWRPKMPS